MDSRIIPRANMSSICWSTVAFFVSGMRYGRERIGAESPVSMVYLIMPVRPAHQE